MKLDKTSSERMDMLRFPLIIGVVFIHAYGSNVNLKGGSAGIQEIGFLSQFIQNFISQGIARVSVPLFFLMSGYLFFLGFNWTLEKYKRKVQNRVKTLVIPFVFWNLATMFFLLVAQSIPATSVFFSGSNQNIATYKVFDFLNSLLGINKYPISYQFWFIRDLFVMVWISPIISALFLNRNISSIILACLFTLWFFNLWPIYIPSIAAIFFFYLGAYLSNREFNLFALDNYGKIIAISYLGLLILDTLTKGYSYNGYIHNAGIIFGIMVAFYLSKYAIKNNAVKRTLLNLSGYSFFVFAIHEPALTVLKKIIYKFAEPSSDLAVIAFYLLIPATIILLSLATYQILNKIMPKALSIVSGGR